MSATTPTDIEQAIEKVDAAINEYAAAILCGEPPKVCADSCKRIKRLVREVAKVVCADVIDMMRAPGRHLTSWDGGWTDEVAEEMIAAIAALPLEEVEDD